MSSLSSRRLSRTLRRLVSALLAISLGVLATASLAGASPPPKPAQPKKQKTATFGIGAANTKGIDGRPDLNYNASPGGHTDDHVAVVNLATKPVTLNIYAADGTNGTNGQIGFLPKAHPGTGSSRWITVKTPGNRPTITLAARQTKVLPISIDIPANAEPGDHLAGIIASLTSKVKGPSGERVNFEQRVALRTVFRVSGPLHPNLAVQNFQATYHGVISPFGSGSATISYTVHNAGNIDLGGPQKVTVSGLFGSVAVKSVPSVPVLLPGGSFPVHLTVHGVWPQIFLHAKVKIAVAGVVGSVNPPLTPSTASSGFFALPWPQLVALLLLAGLGYGALRLRKARIAGIERKVKAAAAKPALGEA